jgi:hypothetical protein
MADVITRLKLESGEYDSKIKRAVTGLQQMESECRKVGGTLAVLEKDQLDYVKSLGQMQTVATSTRGKLNELTQAYTELSVQYKRLTDEEKKGDFGKALSSSLDQLKTRINDTKSQLKDIDKELGNTKQSEDGAKSGLESLTSALGINVKSLAGWGAALAAGKVALDVAKDAFFASEANVDEWGRTMDASKSLYEGFLTALNTGDISGYLSRIDDIVTAARTAYNELDRLGTLKTIQAPKVSAQQTENERIRSMIQTGRYIAPIDGRRNAVFNGREMQNGDKLTAGQIRYLEKQLQNGMQTIVKLVGNEVKQTGKAIDAVYERQAKELGISLKEFRKGTSSMEEFEKRMAGYDKYQQWREQHTTIDQKSGRETVARGNPYAIYGKWGTFRVDGERYNQLVQLIQQRDQQAAQAYGMQSQAYRTMNRAEGFTVSKLMGNGGTGNKNKKEYDDLQKVQQEIFKLTKEAYTADESRVEEIKAEIAGLHEEEKRLTKIRDLVTGKNTTAEVVTGLSGFNEQTISAWTSMMKSEISKADLGSDLYNSLAQNLSDMSTLTTAVQDAMKLGLKIPQEDVQEMFESIFDRGTLPDDLYAGMIQKFIDEFKERTGKDLQVGENGSLSTGKDKKNDDRSTNKLLKLNEETGKYEAKANELLSTMSGGIQNITTGLESLGIEIPAELKSVIGGMQSISAILTGIATTVLAIQAITTADTIIPFAGGGIVGRAASGMLVGNHMSGDNLRLPVNGGSGGFIGVNDGEIILNKAQQGVLTDALQGGGIGNLHLETVISGEDIRVVLKNNGRRTGRGEYITSRNSRS